MKSILHACLFFFLISCSDDNTGNPDEQVIVNKALYNQTITNNYTILQASISNDFLNFTIQSSGCSGSSWKIVLVDSGDIAESYPVQRYVKIALENEELCDAIITRDYSIDITSLRVEDQLYLNLKGWEDQLHYRF